MTTEKISDDEINTNVSGLTSALYGNVIAFVCLMCVFELSRNFVSVQMVRWKPRFIETGRIPPKPSLWPGGWLVAVWFVDEQDFFNKVGLDAYMLLRFITFNLRVACFTFLWGLCILVPIYAHGDGELEGWNKFTIGNVGTNISSLYAAVTFQYLFAFYFCFLIHSEYANFVSRRLQHLTKGDQEKHPQAHYTVKVENIPASLCSPHLIQDFFERQFPGSVYHVEMPQETKSLDRAVKLRFKILCKLEKSIALWKATGSRVKVWTDRKFHYCRPRASTVSEDPSGLGDSALLSAQKQTPLQKTLSTLPIDDSASRRSMEGENSGGGPRRRRASKANHPTISTDKHSVVSRILNAITGIETTKIVSSDPAESLREKFLSVLCPYCLPAERLEEADAIDLYANMLDLMNEYVLALQQAYLYNIKVQRKDSPEVRSRVDIMMRACNMKKILPSASQHIGVRTQGFFEEYNPFPSAGATAVSTSLSEKLVPPSEDEEAQNPLKLELVDLDEEHSDGGSEAREAIRNSIAMSTSGLEHLSEVENELFGQDLDSESKSPLLLCMNRLNAAMLPYLQPVLRAVGIVASAGTKEENNMLLSTAKMTGKGAVQGLYEATKTLELLTFGQYYEVANTAFVTFKTRTAKSMCHQMLLSHKHFKLKVDSAPGREEIVWQNVCVPESQLKLRKFVADLAFLLGAIFWSAIVAFITTLADLDKLANDYPWLQQYRDTAIYQALNNYLAVGLLLILLLCLPFLFDYSAREYEGIKVESEIQGSIMTRFFYYQLANVYVSIISGSISGSLSDFISDPLHFFTVLGEAIPSQSLYFATLVLVKSLTALPIESLRLFQLLTITGYRSCSDRRRATRRELRTGIFYAWPMLYGWIYPNVLMVTLIMLAYATLAPFLTIFAIMYFGMIWFLYRYQMLYVYVNEYQSGGFMWYAVFNRAMVAIMGSTVILAAYMFITVQGDATEDGIINFSPGVMLLPLPCLLYYFWSFCQSKFDIPSKKLSLEVAGQIDQLHRVFAEERDEKGYIDSLPGDDGPRRIFSDGMYRKPSLISAPAFPERYRVGRQNRKGATIVHHNNEIFDQLKGEIARANHSMDSTEFEKTLKFSNSTETLLSPSGTVRQKLSKTEIEKLYHSPSEAVKNYIENGENLPKVEDIISEWEHEEEVGAAWALRIEYDKWYRYASIEPYTLDGRPIVLPDDNADFYEEFTKQADGPEIRKERTISSHL
jgi:hypothetical protein